MCYAVYLSTNSSIALTSDNADLVRFESITDETVDPIMGVLAFANKWYVSSRSGCSCTFRHLMSIELGFSEPVSWYHEGQDHIEATKMLYDVISKLLFSGYNLDCIDRWEGAKPDDIKTLVISLDDVSQKAFRLFENHRFIFR
jgi:hypothetical protein